MHADGSLNIESALRAKKAAETYQQLQASFLVTCGWNYRKDLNLTIAEAFKKYIISNFSVPPKNILTENLSRDTVGDAYFTKIKLAIPNKWMNICVVTSYYHVERTREIFNFVYGDNYKIDVIGANVTSNMQIMDNELSSLNAFRSTFLGVRKGNDAEILNTLRSKHPFYNGVIYDQI